MAGTPSGTVATNFTLNTAIPVGTNVPTAYNVPVAPSSSVTWAAGTGANQINKIASPSGSAAASPASIDLTTVVANDGSTGFSHWRAITVFNDDATHDLLWDFTATNANTAMFSAGGTTAKLTIPPGTMLRFPKPLGTNGYVVDSTHKVISLDPGANTIAYRVVIEGD